MSTPMIYEAITNIMADIDAIGKDQKAGSGSFGYKFRGIDQVINYMKPLLAKHGVFVVPEVLETTREERVNTKGGNVIYSVMKVKHTYYAKDGSSISSIVVGEGMDTGDKASNKALSIAMKYSMFQVFCIPTEEMHDPDAEIPEPSKPVTKDMYISDAMIKTISLELSRTGTQEESLCKKCGVDCINHIPVKYYKAVMDMLKKLPDKKE